MVAEKTIILSAEQEAQLRQPIDEYVGNIQAKLNELRENGTNKVLDIQTSLETLKRDKIYTPQEKAKRKEELQAALQEAKVVESRNKAEVSSLVAQAEAYLKEHFKKDYYNAVAASCKAETAIAKEKYAAAVEELKKEHESALAKLKDANEIKDEKYVHKNRLFDAKMQRDKELQQIKDRRHAAYAHRYHLIDLLRISRFTPGQSMAQRWEN